MPCTVNPASVNNLRLFQIVFQWSNADCVFKQTHCALNVINYMQLEYVDNIFKHNLKMSVFDRTPA